MRLLDTTSLIPVAPSYLVTALTNSYTGGKVLYKAPHRHLNVRWSHIYITSSYLAHTFEDKCISGIEAYNHMVGKLCTLDMDTRHYLTNICEMFFAGPLENLAAQVDMRNIRYVVQKFKFANTIPLLMQLFSSPTWKGKLTAVIRLLELFEVDAFKVTSETLSSISEFVLRVVTWIMEKTEMGIEFVKNKCGWNSPKEEETEMIKLQSNGETSFMDNVARRSTEKFTHGCSFCAKHWSEDPDKCACAQRYHHLIESCECSNDQDCLFRAIGLEINRATVSVKGDLYRASYDAVIQKKYENCIAHYELQDMDIGFGDWTEEIRESFSIPVRASADALWLAGLYYNVNIQLRTPEGVRVYMHSETARWIYLRYMSVGAGHYERDEDLILQPNLWIWGTPFSGLTHQPGFITPKEVKTLRMNSSPSSSASTPPLSHLSDPTKSLSLSTCSSESPSSPAEKADDIKDRVTVNLTNVAEILSEFSDETEPSTPDALSNYVMRMTKVKDDLSLRDKDEEERIVWEKKKNSDPTEKSFLEELTSWNFGAITDRLKNWVKSMSKDCIQFFIDSPFVAGLLSIIAGIAQFLGLYMVMPTTRTGIAALVDKFQNSTRTMHYARNGFKGVMDSVKDCFACCKDMLGISNNAELEKFKEQVTQSLELCRDMLITAQSKPGTFVNDSQRYVEFRKKFLEMSSMYSKLIKFTEPRELAILNPVWFALTKTFDSLTHIYTKFVNGMNSRIVPVCVYLYGATNIGKSAVLSQLSNELNKKMQASMSCYTISKGNIHWNNFAGQQIIRMDDLNSCILPAEGDIDSLHLFNLVTDAPFIPMQAAIPDKGVMAAPYFVMCASNLPTLPSNTMISDVQAWERRRHFCVKVSWPDHEECKGRTDCGHLKGKTPDNFDHLTFEIVPSVMSRQKDASTRVTNHRTGNSFMARKIEALDTTPEKGEEVTLDELVDRCIQMHLQHKQTHAIAFEAAVKAGTMKLQADHWEDNPVVCVEGVPGTGKSTIFANLEKKLENKCHYIRTLEEFRLFAAENFKAPGHTHVIIDDVTTLASHDESWKSFCQLIHGMYNTVSRPPFILVCGVNRGVLVQKFGHDTVDQLMRRMHIIRSCFQKKPFAQRAKAQFMGQNTNYTHEDLHAALKEIESGKKCVDEFVMYHVGDNRLTQGGVVSRIAGYTPQVVTLNQQPGLTIKSKVDMTCMVRIKRTSAQLAKFINNSDFADTLKIISTAELKSYGNSRLTKKKFTTSLTQIAQNCKNLTGVYYDSFDELLLQSRNNNFLEGLRGECALLVLDDVIYYVDYVGECDVGMLDCGIEALQSAIVDLKEVTSFTSTDRIASIVTTLFPPWFTLSLDVFTTVLSIATPTISAMIGCQDLSELYAAYGAWSPVNNMIDTGTQNVFDRTRNTVATKLGVHEIIADKYERVKQVPGPAHMKSPQTFFADDLDRSFFKGDATGETKAYPDSKSSGNQKWVHAETKAYPDKKSHKVDWRAEVARNQEGILPYKEEYCERPFVDVSLTAPLLETSAEPIMLHTAAPEGKKEEIIQQVTSDPSLYPIVNHVIKNCCEILDQHGIVKCTGIFVKENIIRTVLHLRESCDINRLYIRTVEGLKYPTRVLYTEEIHDRLDLEVTDKTFESRADITNHLPNRTSQIPPGAQAILVTFKGSLLKSGPAFTIRSYMIKDVTYKVWSNLTHAQQVIDYRGHKVGQMLVGDVYTTYGDCGSLLILSDPHFNSGKLIGIHVGATTKHAYASPLYRDQYAEFLQKQSVQNTSRIPRDLFPLEPVREGGLATSDLPIYIPSKTKLFKNWYPLGPKCYEPAVLDGRDSRSTRASVLFDEATRWCRPREEITLQDQRELSECMDDIAHYVASVMEGEGIQLTTLTSKQALNKYQGSAHSEPINIHSSSGFPWNHQNKYPGKTKFIEVDDTGIRHFNKKDRKVFDKLQNEINRFTNPELSKETGKMAIFQVFLKDEPVKLKKIYKETKTRTIAAAPIDYQIAYRRYIHTAHCAIMDCHHLLPIKVGINPLSLEWHDLFMSLASVNTQAIDLDYKGWDFSTPPYIISLLPRFYDILYRKLDPNYEPEHNKVRESLYSQIMNFHLLIGRTLYQSTGGIPSGYPGTAYDNSLINWLISYWAFRQIAKRSNPKLANFSAFRELVSPAIYGDDIIMSVHNDVLKSFNGLTIPDVVARIGFEAQPADKGDIFVSARPLKECIFLSRHFKYASGFWIGPLQKDHLFKPSWYVSDRRTHLFWLSPEEYCKSPDIVAASYESMLYEAALHNDETFELVHKAAMAVYRDYPLQMPITKKEAIARIFGDTIRYHNVDELSFHDLSKFLQDYQPPCRPPKFIKFKNRISYSYGATYVYPGSSITSNPTPKAMKRLLAALNKEFGKEWNSVLVNEYLPGGEIPWHKDNEPELDIDHGVLGLTVIGDGTVSFRRGNEIVPYLLSYGAGYLMERRALTNYEHCRDSHTKFTMSYTFRKIN
uniref:Polyprotein n=1 Tax=Picornavirales sp. TaxID=1955153 RepID=A0A6M9Z8Z4_9VIRU|nr:MAG: hypothetical protein 1 [Picornavirales sp.]